MTETPKCPHACEAPQEAGATFFEGRRIPGHRTKQGGFVMGHYGKVAVRLWTCSACHKVYQVDEPAAKKTAKKKATKAGKKRVKKRGKKPKTRKRNKAD